MTNAFGSPYVFPGTPQFGINDLVLNTGLDLHILPTFSDPTPSLVSFGDQIYKFNRVLFQSKTTQKRTNM